jgi:hypothetical protein
MGLNAVEISFTTNLDWKIEILADCRPEDLR